MLATQGARLRGQPITLPRGRNDVEFWVPLFDVQPEQGDCDFFRRQVTVTPKPVTVGTDVTIMQAGVPEVIPAEACYLGGQESLTLLAKLVEAEIPD